MSFKYFYSHYWVLRRCYDSLVKFIRRTVFQTRNFGYIYIKYKHQVMFLYLSIGIKVRFFVLKYKHKYQGKYTFEKTSLSTSIIFQVQVKNFYLLYLYSSELWLFIGRFARTFSLGSFSLQIISRASWQTANGKRKQAITISLGSSCKP